ncbi:MAG: hypothetical protein WDO71_25120 [Bacteroidota bacterium]
MTTTELLPIILSSIFLIVYTFLFLNSKNKKNKNLVIDEKIDLGNSTNPLSIEFDEIITTPKLENQLTFFADTIYKIRSHIDNSYTNPYKISNINSILVSNMHQGSNSIKDFLFPIFNHLCEFNNSLYTYFIGNFFEALISKKLVSSTDLSNNIKEHGSNNLKKTLFLHFLKAKVNYSDLRNLILDLTEDDTTIETYSDILALSYFKEPERIITLLNEITPKYNLLNIGKLEDKRELSILKLTIFFFVKILIDSKGKIDNISTIKKLLFDKYKFIFDSIYSTSSNPISLKVKQKVFTFLEAAGIQQWNKGIGNNETGRQINNYFFVEYPDSRTSQKIQREQLDNYFPYFIDLFNETLESKKEVDFINKSMEMIELGNSV